MNHRDTESAEIKYLNEISGEVIEAAIEVHRHLGPGLLESTYEACLSHELKLRDLVVEKQVPIPVFYKGVNIDCAYRLDFLIAKKVIVELKAVEKILPIHEAQTLTYLKLCKLRLGLIINFNVPILKNGIKRLLNH